MQSFYKQITKTTGEKSVWTDLNTKLIIIIYTYFFLE